MPTARVYKRKPGAVFKKKAEESEQQRFVNWVKKNYPQVIIFCDAIGEDLTESGRRRVSSMRSDTIPDVIIDYPSLGYSGARFEFKKTGTVIYKKDGVTLRKQPYVRRYKNGTVKRGDHLRDQADTLIKYNNLGYYARFVIGLSEAKRHFRYYLDVPIQEELF